MKRWQIIFLVFLIVATAMILTKNTPYHTDEGRIFGTSYRITYKHKENLHEDIKNILQQVDNSLSPFNKNSTIRDTTIDPQIKSSDADPLAQNSLPPGAR